jgi:maltose alpha-D-glucosyltransferase/alpha-amylase
MDRKITAQRVRTHGDYRLGSLLSTGKDFVIIDLEGEVLRPLSNRRHKRSPLRDVASLLHSLYSASRTVLKEGNLRPEDLALLAPWTRYWHLWTSVSFVKAYLAVARSAPFLPSKREDMQTLLQFFLLGRGVFELRYQLLNRPDRVQIALRSILHLLELGSRSSATQEPGVRRQDSSPVTVSGPIVATP